MARWDAGDFAQNSLATTHSLGVTPKAVLTLTATTAAPNTTTPQIAAVGVGAVSSTGTIAGQHALGYAAVFLNSSAQNRTHGGAGSVGIVAMTVGGSSLGAVADFATTALGRSGSTGAPVALALIGGDDILASSFTTAAISTVASTQASTGYGFQPNAAIVLGQSFVTSCANFSFGFACIDSAGTKKQWSISQTAREGAGAAAYRSASTVSALKLHTSASTAHDVSVTSFRSDGLELTVNATDTARAATVSILGLSVPKVDAGKATITTNGAGSGLTGFTVTGLGQNVGLVILASIGTSLQTLQPSNAFSIGFASSNGNQRCVSGYVQTTEETGAGSMNTSRYCSYFGTSHAVIFTSASAADGPLVDDKGLFAVTSDGFTVTFGSTIPNGRDVYWGAFMNVVTDIEAHILSSGSLQANLAEVQRLSAAIGSPGEVNANLTPDFVVSESKLHGKAKTILRVDDGHDHWANTVENSSSPAIERDFDVTTVPQRIGLATFNQARTVLIAPPPANPHPMRLAGSVASLGTPLSSRGMNTFSVSEGAGTDLYLYTTEAGTTIESVRVILR